MINDLWYKNAVIYCLSVDSFMDANGDGIGDFAGLMRRVSMVQGGRSGLPAEAKRHRRFHIGRTAPIPCCALSRDGFP